MAARRTGRQRRTPSGRWTSVSTLPGVAAPTDPDRSSTGRSRHRTTGEHSAPRLRGRRFPGRKRRPANRKRSPSAQHATVRPGLLLRVFSRLSLHSSVAGFRGNAWPKALGVFVALAALSLGGYAGYRFVTSSHYFALRKVTFSPTEHVSAQQLRALAALSSKDNVFSLDLAAVARRVASHPWILSAKATRRLPGEIHVEVVEQQPVAAVLMGGMYLVNASGALFKRAAFDEARALPLVTGISRDEYEQRPGGARERIRIALAALRAYGARKGRPLLGEVHLDERNAVTLYARKTGLQIRLGRGAFLTKLSRFDAVWAALGDRRRLLRVVRLDNRVRPERVTVRLADDLDGSAQAVEPAKEKPASSAAQAGATMKTSRPIPAKRPAARANAGTAKRRAKGSAPGPSPAGPGALAEGSSEKD